MEFLFKGPNVRETLISTFKSLIWSHYGTIEKELGEEEIFLASINNF